jgi:hypothetical protein
MTGVWSNSITKTLNEITKYIVFNQYSCFVNLFRFQNTFEERNYIGKNNPTLV